MTKQEFFNKCLETIESEGYPNDGITYIKLKSGQEGFLSTNIFHNLQPSELATFALILALNCDKVHSISRLFTHGLLRNQLEKAPQNDAINPYLSLVSLDFENSPDLYLIDSDYPKYNKNYYSNWVEECYTFNPTTKELVYASLLTDINNDLLQGEIQQVLLFTQHWRKFHSKATEKSLEYENPIGDNNLKNNQDINNLIKNYYSNHYSTIYSSVDKFIDAIRNPQKTSENTDHEEDRDQLLSRLLGKSNPKPNDQPEDENLKNTNKKTKNNKENDKNSKLDQPNSQLSGGSFLSKIRKKFK